VPCFLFFSILYLPALRFQVPDRREMSISCNQCYPKLRVDDVLHVLQISSRQPCLLNSLSHFIACAAFEQRHAANVIQRFSLNLRVA
jgi:hypothetical protein